ncbi:hypothetical protein BT93_A0504 [Corymbia citriodora subsp. variegata]|nr:hypothetical protein BT93_A0504 [Corymbia citriodora subsp. variegata]
MAKHDSVKVLVLMSLLLILDNACVCLCRNRSSSSICFEDERDALLQLKQSLSNTSHILSSWNSKDCCQWTGVKCDRADGHVVMLQIIRGTKFLFASELNSSLLNLRYLRYLELSGILFKSANILNYIGSMKQLRYLNLSNSFNFTTVPREWGNLTKLEVLDLRSNFLGGAIEDIRWVSHLQALKYLDMSGLNITGSRDPMQVISKLPSLSHLCLSNCGLYEFHMPTSLHLQYLDLSSNYIDGSIPSIIFRNMTSLHLQYLDLSSNYINGSIPSIIFRNMTSLLHLDLSWNHFRGPIPNTIFRNMTSLWYLDLSWNSFDGSIPSTIFRNITSLRYLDLSTNILNSSVPWWFDNLRSLVYLNLEENFLQSIEGGLSCFLRNKPFLKSLLLGNNELHGEIFSVEGNSSSLIGKNLVRWEIDNNFRQGALPNWLVHLKNLTILDLSNNQLTGNIPEALGRLQGLSSLDLSNNLLNGTVPHSLGQLQDLRHLDLSANSLRGTISEIHFSNLSKLSFLDISNNYLAFKVDSDWIPPFNLQSIRIMSCEFGTEFPRWIRTQVQAEEIVLSNASITGALPDWLGLMSFSRLYLSYNQINGYLPKFPSNLNLLDLSHNLISGPIQQDIVLVMPHLKGLYLNDNLLSGPIPTSLCEMRLLVLDLGRNKLVGKIPACWKTESPMFYLDLSSNKLSGIIPSSLGNLIGLNSLHLNNNSLHGEIPVTMNHCNYLVILDLGENKISGTVPPWFGPSFQFLQILRLRVNMFNGRIPSQLCLLPALQILDLAVNNLTGMIPNCLGYMKGMKLNKSIDEGNFDPGPPWLFADIGWTEWNQVKQVVKGMVLDYKTLDLQLMVNLDLSSNKLNGPIPEELTLLSKLRGLNLSRNFLSGGIPTIIGDMKLLESLDLSNNSLSGTIPQSFSAFTSLSKLNLSHNNFTGPIPKGNQIQTLVDPSIYANNPLLCGDPLPKKCLGAKAPEVPKEDTNEEGKLEKVMFYLVTMLGFATGFWGVIGVLVYRKNWRRVYFDYVDRKTNMVFVIVVVKVNKLRRRLRRA